MTTIVRANDRICIHCGIQGDGCQCATDSMAEPHPCDECGTVYDEASGDGWCGLCPSCADKDPCNLCGHFPCDCDDQYEAWKDRQWER